MIKGMESVTLDQASEINRISQLAGKPVLEIVIVQNDGKESFAITQDYEKVCKDLGLRIGSMCGSEPRALSMTATYIAKWRNIPMMEYEKLDGFVLCEDNREGRQAAIVLF
jgi:hypothetical protein